MIRLGTSQLMKPGNKREFDNAKEAVNYVRKIYETNTTYLRHCFERFAKEKWTPNSKIEACYPYVAITVQRSARVDTRLSYGYVRGPGRYSTTLTRPDIFERYYLEQFEQLLKNHKVKLEVGVSNTAIPLKFAFNDSLNVEGVVGEERAEELRYVFSVIDLAEINNSIANGTYRHVPGSDHPLSIFTAPRVDYSLHRLRYYTGTDPAHFQSYVIFTNYDVYTEMFVSMGKKLIEQAANNPSGEQEESYNMLIEPDFITATRTDGTAVKGPSRKRKPQMPAYHLMRRDGKGITMVNVGVGPSNCKNISDNIAVLRPDAWIMLGHCAGLRETQKVGDYILAHAYQREDGVLDSDVPLWVPVPALAEIQQALETAVAEITGQTGYALKSVMRTGTVATTADRNWEMEEQEGLSERLRRSRAIAIDMESATIATNGFRYRVPYGTLLCVSDRPLRGDIKLPGMADEFFRKMVPQHFRIGIRAMELLRKGGPERLHSRKLRSFTETAFR